MRFLHGRGHPRDDSQDGSQDGLKRLHKEQILRIHRPPKKVMRLTPLSDIWPHGLLNHVNVVQKFYRLPFCVGVVRFLPGRILLFVYICIDTTLRIHIYMRRYVYIHTHSCLAVCMHMSTFICMHLYSYVYLCLHTCTLFVDVLPPLFISMVVVFTSMVVELQIACKCYSL